MVPPGHVHCQSAARRTKLLALFVASSTLSAIAIPSGCARCSLAPAALKAALFMLEWRAQRWRSAAMSAVGGGGVAAQRTWLRLGAWLLVLALSAAATLAARSVVLAAARARAAPSYVDVPNPWDALRAESAPGAADAEDARAVLLRQAEAAGDAPTAAKCKSPGAPWTPLLMRLPTVEPWCQGTIDGEAELWLAQALAFHAGYHMVSAYDSFKACQHFAPRCFMCHLGEALAFADTINDNASAQMRIRGQNAASRAKRSVSSVSKQVRELAEALVEAVIERFQESEERNARYAAAMDAAAALPSTSADALALAAEAHMLLVPWRFYRHGNGSFYPYAYPLTMEEPAAKAMALLDAALARNPSHALALHLRVHLLEPSDAAHSAESTADALAELARGPFVNAVDHLTHMPSHIYLNVGRLADAARANELALANAARGASLNCAYGYKLAHDAHFAAVAHARLGATAPARARALQAAGRRLSSRGCLVAAVAALAGQWSAASTAADQGARDELAKPFDKAACEVYRALAAAARRDSDTARNGEGAATEACRRASDDRSKKLCEAALTAASAATAFASEDFDKGLNLWRKAAEAAREVRYVEPPLWILPTDDDEWPCRFQLCKSESQSDAVQRKE